MSITPIFAWYDIWVGAYWDRSNRVLYLFPIPFIGLKIDFKESWRKQVKRLTQSFKQQIKQLTNE